MGDSTLQPAPGVLKLYDGLSLRMLFWPMVPRSAGKLADVPFDIVATDIAGRTLSFSLPLLFVGKLADARKSPRSAPRTTPRRPPRSGAPSAGGAIVTYAPGDPTDKGDTALPTQT